MSKPLINQDALHRFDGFPQTGKGKARHVLAREIFPEYPALATAMVGGLRILAAWRRGDFGDIEPIDFDPSTLKPTQPGIFRDKFKRHLKRGDTGAPVVVWKKGTEKFLLDGHHKVVVALLTGDPVVPAIVIDPEKIAKDAKMVHEEQV